MRRSPIDGRSHSGLFSLDRLLWMRTKVFRPRVARAVANALSLSTE